jgi:hypothetical protein
MGLAVACIELVEELEEPFDLETNQSKVAQMDWLVMVMPRS